jgi:hypothetical protein
MGTFGYLVDLSTIKLSDGPGGTTSWIQGMPYGTWQHPFYGEIKVDADRVAAFTASVNERVRGVDPDIDYDHKMFTGKAAGWVQAAEAHPTEGLRLLVKWTAKAAQEIKDGAYRYFSPEFADEWEHPQTGVKFKDVLFGGGITNRPFLKGIAPVNLNEMFGATPPNPQEGGEVDLKKLRGMLKLSDDVSDADVLAKAAEQLQKLNEPPAPPTPPVPTPPANPAPTTPPPTEPPNTGTPAPVSKLGEVPPNAPEDLKSLFEANPHIRDLVQAHEQARQVVIQQRAALQLAEVERKLADINMATGRHIKLTPVFLSEAKELLLALNEDQGKKFFDMLTMMVDGKSLFFELGERGRSRNDLSSDSMKDYPRAIEKALSENKGMQYAEAARKVAIERPELVTDYQNAVRG